MKKNILITGLPRSGKSTLLKDLIKDFPEKVGFVTNEVRKDGERVGFEIETDEGKMSLLASTDFNTPYKVSRYYVNLDNLESSIKDMRQFGENDILYLDEIGQMELFSTDFKELCLRFLDSDNICIATMSAVYQNGFIEEIKKRSDVSIIEISEKDRDSKREYIISSIHDLVNNINR